MGEDTTSVGKVFIEYVVINRARNDRIALKGLLWEESEGEADTDIGEEAERSYPLTVTAGDARYVARFSEEEIRYCLSRPSCFSSVERKINALVVRIRQESVARFSQG